MYRLHLVATKAQPGEADRKILDGLILAAIMLQVLFKGLLTKKAS